jgi:uncharacterized protein YegP (UPF0339 family)
MRFEVTQLRDGRYSWSYVDVDREDERAVALSARSYVSKEQALRAVDEIRKDAAGAGVVELPEGCAEPAATFSFVDDVVPLYALPGPSRGQSRQGRDPYRAKDRSTADQVTADGAGR